MKIGIALALVGMSILVFMIPYSLMNILSSLGELSEGRVSGGIPAYLLILGVFVGFVLTVIGATEIFLRKK